MYTYYFKVTDGTADLWGVSLGWEVEWTAVRFVRQVTDARCVISVGQRPKQTSEKPRV